MGYGFGNGFRAELEGLYLNTKGKGLTGFTRTGAANGGGTQQKYGPMVNVLYDFNGISPSFVPYIGAGVGALWINDQLHASNAGPFAMACNHGWRRMVCRARRTRTNAVFAYQAIVGFAVPIASVPGLALTADYRFVGTTGNRSELRAATRSTSTTAGRTTTTTAAGKVQMGPTYDNTVMVGIRYNFGQTPPPAPAPVAAAPAPIARSYLVFFDWDKYNLTDRARQIVAEAAANSTKVQYTKIEVNGFTDTSGTPQVQHGPVDPPRQHGGRGTGEGRRAEGRDRDPGFRRDPPAGADRPEACVSRRTGASKSSSSKFDATTELNWGTFGCPFSFLDVFISGRPDAASVHRPIARSRRSEGACHAVKTKAGWARGAHADPIWSADQNVPQPG